MAFMSTFKQFIDQIGSLTNSNRIAVVGLMLLAGVLYCFLIQVGTVWVLLTQGGLLKRILHPGNFPKGSRLQECADTLRKWLDQTSLPEEAAPRNLVRSPARSYELCDGIGSGDLCNVHRAESEGHQYVVKVQRSPGCDSLLAKEQLILRQLHNRNQGDTYTRYLPIPVERFRWEHCSYFTYVLRPGLLSAAEIRWQYPRGLDGRHIAWMFNRTLEVLGFAHRKGWIHGAVLPPHLLFDPHSHGLQLLGWVHSEPYGQPLRFVSREFKSWYPPACHRRESATGATDIYLAVRSMVWLAGGDPLSEAMPEHLPMEMRCFFQNCLVDSAEQRPQDAWLLHEDFKSLLEVIYGPPQFCPLLVT